MDGGAAVVLPAPSGSAADEPAVRQLFANSGRHVFDRWKKRNTPERQQQAAPPPPPPPPPAAAGGGSDGGGSGGGDEMLATGGGLPRPRPSPARSAGSALSVLSGATFTSLEAAANRLEAATAAGSGSPSQIIGSHIQSRRPSPFQSHSGHVFSPATTGHLHRGAAHTVRSASDVESHGPIGTSHDRRGSLASASSMGRFDGRPGGGIFDRGYDHSPLRPTATGSVAGTAPAAAAAAGVWTMPEIHMELPRCAPAPSRVAAAACPRLLAAWWCWCWCFCVATLLFV